MSHLYQSSVLWISLLVHQSLNLIQKSDTGVLQLRLSLHQELNLDNQSEIRIVLRGPIRIKYYLCEPIRNQFCIDQPIRIKYYQARLIIVERSPV